MTNRGQGSSSHHLLDIDPRGVFDPRRSVIGAHGERLLRQNRYPTLTGHIVGLTLTVVGVGIFLSGLVDAIDGGPDVLVLLLTGVVMGGFGAVMWRRTITPKQIRVLDVFSAVTVTWVDRSVVLVPSS